MRPPQRGLVQVGLCESIPEVLDHASAFSDVTPGWVHEAEGRRGRRVRKSRQKEAAGAADAGVMQIEWIERGV